MEGMRKEISFVVFFLYPGMTVKIFRVFKCVPVDGESYLYEDLSVQCWDEEHMPYVILAIVCIAVIVFGIPITTYFLLRSMRPSLYDEKHSMHEETLEKYGSLYEQYEEQYYAWEVLVMLKKMVRRVVCCA